MIALNVNKIFSFFTHRHSPFLRLDWSIVNQIVISGIKLPDSNKLPNSGDTAVEVRFKTSLSQNDAKFVIASSWLKYSQSPYYICAENTRQTNSSKSTFVVVCLLWYFSAAYEPIVQSSLVLLHLLQNS